MHAAARWLGWVFVLCTSVAVSARDGVQALRFETLSSEHGLSENSVKAIAEDAQGFVWFGTERGLNRFDGLEFKVFAADDDPVRGPREGHVNALLLDRDGLLWIGTFGGGLSRFDPSTETFATWLHAAESPSSLAHDDVGALHQDTAGRLWVGTQGGTLQRFDPTRNEFVRIASAPEATSDRVSALADDGAGGLWVGTLGAGLLHLERSDGLLRAAPEALALGRDITALLQDRQGRLWIGTRREGLALREAHGALRRFRGQDGDSGDLAHDTVNRLHQDRDGQIWIGTARGLDRYDEASDRFLHHQHEPGDPSTLPYNDVWAVLVDSLGTLWVGTGGGGVARHARPAPQFTLLEHAPDDPRGAASGGVWSLLEDAQGALWVGTLDGGLQHAAAGATRYSAFRQRSDRVEPLTDDDVRGLAEGTDGSLWIGTRHGLNRLDRGSGRVRRYLHDPARADSLAHDYVRPLRVDAAGTLWVGTYGGGLDRYDAARDAFEHHRHEPTRADSLSDDRVYALLADRDGSLWVGTHGGGLNRLDPQSGRFARFRHSARDPHSLANDRVLALQQDGEGAVWVGTGAGLDRATDAGFEHIEGLRRNVIYGIVVDAAGQLWMSTDDGIVRFDPTQRALQRYPMRELWGNSEFNGGAWHAGRSGQLYFGGISGVVRVAPDRIAQDTDATRVVLTDFTLFNRSVANAGLDPHSPLPLPVQFADRLTLDHTQGIFGFGFAALRANSPERRRFAYRLDGFHERWLETAGRNRGATFTGVPPGNYTFRVRATGADGAWLKDEAQVDITILPAPWRSPSAYAGYAAMLLALVGFLARQRWRRLAIERRAQRELAQSEERLSLSLWGSGDEMLDWDLARGTVVRQGGESGRETRSTEGLHDIDALAPWVHPDDWRTLSRALREHFAGRTPHLEVSYRARTHALDWPWKLVRGQVVARDDAGAPLRFAGTQKDITRIKAVEAELRELNEALDERVRQRTRELEVRQAELVEAEKMASLGRLVAGVAHEVNTPLGVGITAMSYLREQLDALKSKLLPHFGDAEAARLVTPILRAGALAEGNLVRASELVRTFKQVAVDQTDREFRCIGVLDYLASTMQALKPRLDAAGLQIAFDGERDLRMIGRPDALAQILVQLVLNSIMHGYPKGGPGTVRVEVVARGNQVRLTYSDDGAGMPPEVSSRIFEPFFTTRRGSGGTGLGMHIVYNVVTHALGGRISCSTQSGEGVLFAIEFPATHPDANAGEVRVRGD